MYYRLPMDPLFIYSIKYWQLFLVLWRLKQPCLSMLLVLTALSSNFVHWISVCLFFFVLIRCKNILYHNTNITRCKLADTNKIPFVRFFSAKLWSINSEVYMGLFLFISCCVHIHTCTKFCKQTSHPYMYEWLVKQTTLFLGMIKIYWECVLMLLSYTCW